MIIKIKTHLTKILLSVIVVLVVLSAYLSYQNFQLKKQLQPKPTPLHRSSAEVFQEARKEITNKELRSPSEEKYLTYKYSKDFDEYGLHLFNGEKEQNIGRLNEPVHDLETFWSPDESRVVVSASDDLTRIYCVSKTDGECNGKLVFYLYGGASVFWSDNQTIYIAYIDKGNNVVSRLDFSTNSIYPQQVVLYKEPWSGFFAYCPVSISPNKVYLVMEFRYEGAPTLSIMNTQTGKIVDLRKNNELYVIGKNPDYTWNNNQLTFTGGLTTDGSWLGLADKNTHEINDSLLEVITIDVSTLF